EGIGDKHVPWIHNSKNTDFVAAIDDQAVVNLSRLFNETEGRKYLVSKGVPEAVVNRLDLLGFSGISNVLSAVKFAKYNELGENDVVLTVLTDSMELYGSRLKEMRQEFGEYTAMDAAADDARYLKGQSTEYLLELTYPERRRIHNLKYFTWVEQQGRTYDELMAQWYQPDYWTEVQKQVVEIDDLIIAFNKKAGLN
ncbi:MAG TPA: pyridoxal-5-phosphate-dependent protein subunit beta, partial [Anaerolineaceae bacterium]